MEIKGKTALITGGSKRIGKTITIGLAKEGCDVIIHYNYSEKEAQELKTFVESFGVKGYLLKADLTEEKDIIKLSEEASNIGVDILINNASIYYKAPLETATFKDLDTFYSIHVKAPFYLSKILGKKMYEKKEGRIINIVDYSAILPYPDYTPYTASKGALLTMTKAFAKEFAPYVLVNGILPGPIVPPEDLQDKELPLKKTLLKRWGGEQEIFKAVKYLIETEFTTGSLIPVEGGRLIF
ncbi:SDR family NAD(P)-dependent oxidoreductase [Sulfurihydrogenibium subterraneum]|uniref:SDR family NAD(P)-dependent oxidoreductase n=1 Tax=Sulfurihydrogenibium subterraneum TaxID=171121 RepID=UPI000491B091|nr:SDR family NAD(P)-dependent oxidoreductase [Sulfurihydrogenibium subterraneum]